MHVLRIGLGVFTAAAVACAQPFNGEAIAIAKDGKGIGFDDLRYSGALHRILVPAGRTGTIVMIDPATHHTALVSGLASEPSYAGGHGEGTTSVDVGDGVLYATDRTTGQVVSIDTTSRRISSRTALAGSPDYVRFVAPTHEVWVTEPDADRIEVFTITADGLKHSSFIAIDGGPESLVIDPAGGRAYTHLWSGTSLAIDVRSRKIVARWPNQCEGSRGIAYDEQLHFLFAGCAEGKAVVMDTTHGGAVLGTASTGGGVDIIDYDPVRRHLYMPGARSATLTIFSVGTNGSLVKIKTAPTARGSHCVATDGKAAYVCDPDRGRILVVPDP